MSTYLPAKIFITKTKSIVEVGGGGSKLNIHIIKAKSVTGQKYHKC